MMNVNEHLDRDDGKKRKQRTSVDSELSSREGSHLVERRLAVLWLDSGEPKGGGLAYHHQSCSNTRVTATKAKFFANID